MKILNIEGRNDMPKKEHMEFVLDMKIKNPRIRITGQYDGMNKRVACLCEVCGHEWSPFASNIYHGHKGCPNCAREGKTSFPEQAIYFYCKQVTHAINRYGEFGAEIDVYLPELNIGIEYNGSVWHKNKDKDVQKIGLLKNKGIHMITIEDGDSNIVDGDVITHKSIDWAIKMLFEILGFEDIGIDTRRDSHMIYEQYFTIKVENSFAVKNPDGALQWDYEKNGKITPQMIYSGSNKKFWRICPICGNSYLVIIEHWNALYGCNQCRGVVKMNDGAYNAKSIWQCSINGDKIKRWGSISEASRVLHINTTSIYRCCVGVAYTAGGFRWCEDNAVEYEKLLQRIAKDPHIYTEDGKHIRSGLHHPLYGKYHSEEAKQKIREHAKIMIGEDHPNAKKFYIFDVQNKLVYTALTRIDAAKFLNIHEATVTKRCKDHMPLQKKKYAGYTVWFADEYDNLTNQNEIKEIEELKDD